MDSTQSTSSLKTSSGSISWRRWRSLIALFCEYTNDYGSGWAGGLGDDFFDGDLFHIYNRQRYWPFFAGWRCADSEYLFVGLMRDELFDPTTMQREESTPNSLRNSRRNQSKCKAGAGNRELVSGRVPRRRRKPSPAGHGQTGSCSGCIGSPVERHECRSNQAAACRSNFVARLVRRPENPALP